MVVDVTVNDVVLTRVHKSLFEKVAEFTIPGGSARFGNG
jgi:hypothetical protein